MTERTRDYLPRVYRDLRLENPGIGGAPSVLRTDGIVRCSNCSSPVAPRSLLERVVALTASDGSDLPAWATRCADCRATGL